MLTVKSPTTGFNLGYDREKGDLAKDPNFQTEPGMLDSQTNHWS